MRTAAAHPDQAAALAAFHGPLGVDGPSSFAEITTQVHFGHAESDLTPEALGELNRSLGTAKTTACGNSYVATARTTARMCTRRSTGRMPR